MAASRALFCLAILSFGSPSAFAAEQAPIGFRQVDAQVFRGGRPGSEDTMGWLAHRGIRTIVNLQGNGWQILPGETPPAIADGRQLARDFGLGFYNFPVPAGGTLTADDERMMLSVVRVMEDPRFLPVYVHCNVGADRTGVIVAAYRILHENCSFEQARRELVRDGALWTPILEGGQFDFLRALEANPESFGHPRTNLRCPLR